MKEYDLVIVGGGTAGCACAWNASRLGLKTLLIEKKDYLGGAITAQLVVPAMKTNQNGLNIDFYNALCAYLNTRNSQITYSDGNSGWFNPLTMPEYLYKMLTEQGCDVLLDCSVTDLHKEPEEYIDTKHSDNITNLNTKILSIYIGTNYNDNVNHFKYNDTKYSDNTLNKNPLKISAKNFVDATGDGIFSKICGAHYLPKEGTQALSLRFIMSDIDKKAFGEWLLQLDADRNVTTVYETDDDIHLSTACTWDKGANWALRPIFDKAVEEGILKDTDRAYFQIFSIAGERDKIAFNCPRLFNDKPYDPFLPEQNKQIRQDAIEIIKRLKSFCVKHFKGFERAKIYKIADELGVRESNRVKGKYVLTKEDIYNAKTFENPVAYSNYPIDVHSIKRDDSTLAYVQKDYQIPLESLMVEGFSNLFVVGRCLSADFYAQAAVRIQPTCFSMGEGLAKYLAQI